MQFTLRQACVALGPYAYTVEDADVVSAINSAILSLSSFDAWDRLRKVIRIQVKGPYFSLPQDAASVVRACVNGTPSVVMGQDYRFLSSGPGDLTRIPTGYQYLDPGVVDLGVYPTMFELPGASHLVAYCQDSSHAAQPNIVVTGHLDNGELRTTHLSVARRENILGSVETYVSIDRFSDVTSVVIDGPASSYIYLYAVRKKEDLWKKDSEGVVVGQYHPHIVVPEFRRYMVPGANNGKVYDILCEVRINPLPLVDDNDVLPFSTLEPVKYALMANRYFSLGEVDAGIKYRELAIQTLTLSDRTEEKKQTLVVNNMVIPNSLGEMSEQYAFL